MADQAPKTPASDEHPGQTVDETARPAETEPNGPLAGLMAAGAEVKEGDLLLTIEAMKMETGLHADRDGTIKSVHVTAGAQIDAKDLLVEFE